ncbi:MAG: acetate--CoA ligase family protein [Methanoregula sp.]|nr:acetate--CoA ligase family protein [Methanoregula sp.]
MLSEAEGYDILRKYDLPVPDYQIVKNGEDAGYAAECPGCPVVMKIISPEIIHKSDAGGVIVGIGSKKAALGAFTKIIDGAKAYNPDAHIEGVIGGNRPGIWQGHHFRYGGAPWSS